ncbi:MAG: PEP-CTERM sorting domain-containing protein [Candidatus Electrothrix sp. GM3_4]|nr:PEP-CTERM sorting domain-containing protein [Candidatus Electrothrix sp. GM3_4]
MKKILAGLATGLITLSIVSISHAIPVTTESFNTGLNTDYFVSHATGDVDWFVFDYDGVDPLQVSFWFDRTVSNLDLVAGLYRGDTTGFDYGSNTSSLHRNAATYNSNLTFIQSQDDTHNDTLGGPWGDPHFAMNLSADRYSLVLQEFWNGGGGTYSVITNMSSASSVPEPSAMFFLGTGLIGLVGSRFKKIKNKKTNA